jgi:hypothetical protein
MTEFGAQGRHTDGVHPELSRGLFPQRRNSLGGRSRQMGVKATFEALRLTRQRRANRTPPVDRAGPRGPPLITEQNQVRFPDRRDAEGRGMTDKRRHREANQTGRVVQLGGTHGKIQASRAARISGVNNRGPTRSSVASKRPVPHRHRVGTDSSLGENRTQRRGLRCLRSQSVLG